MFELRSLIRYLRLPALAACLCGGPVASAAESIEIPLELSRGQLLYEKYCSGCHGTGLDGSDQGPPLVHPYYKPSHHDDGTFYRAVLEGVRQHHWNFGDMPPVSAMTPGKTEQVIAFIRYYQQQQGLY